MNNDIQWGPVKIGVIIASAFFLVSEIISFLNFALQIFLFTGIAVGFMVGTDIKRGAINGAITGIIASLIVLLILVVTYSILGWGSYLINALDTGSILTFLIIEVILTVIGGVLGSVIKKESIMDRFPGKSDE